MNLIPFPITLKMRTGIEEVAGYFGYNKENARIRLPLSDQDLPLLSQLFAIG